MVIKPFQAIAVAVSLILVWGCRPSLIPFDETVPAQSLTYVGAPPITDARARFRAIFCELLNKKQAKQEMNIGCDEYLWRLIDEQPPNDNYSKLPDYDPSIIFLLVPGAFSECVGDIGLPYQEAAGHLQKKGYQIHTINVSGLSSCQKNAKIIAGAVANQNLNSSQRLVLMGYSKGTTDILHFLIDYPELAHMVDAVVSVAGAVNGTPLADRYYRSRYDNWFASHSFAKCEPGDGGLFDSLSRIAQVQWMATHPLPAYIQYFSIASFAKFEDIQTFLRPTYKLLAKIDPLNDGQLLIIDQLIPGSALLGYVNADHWSVAVAVEEEYSNRNLSLQDWYRKLRELLFEAMILFVTENLNRL